MTNGMILNLRVESLLEKRLNSEIGLLKMVAQDPLAREDSALRQEDIIYMFPLLVLGHIGR